MVRVCYSLMVVLAVLAAQVEGQCLAGRLASSISVDASGELEVKILS
jgi:hypothetical protein